MPVLTPSWAIRWAGRRPPRVVGIAADTRSGAVPPLLSSCRQWRGLAVTSRHRGYRAAQCRRITAAISDDALMTSFAVGRTVANVNPPVPAPQITGADT